MTTSETRRRIVQATRALHEEVGPAATTITAIAERAGVQRLTVYRHFPDEAALIGACSADWSEDNPLPDPAVWSGIQQPSERLRCALDALYGYFEKGAPMLDRVLSDEPEVPELEDVMAPWWDFMREVRGGLSAGWGVEPDVQRLVQAAVGHAIRFSTWSTLRSEGLTTGQAVDLMGRLVEEVAEPCHREES